jgi:hypothetical protein
MALISRSAIPYHENEITPNPKYRTRAMALDLKRKTKNNFFLDNRHILNLRCPELVFSHFIETICFKKEEACYHALT